MMKKTLTSNLGLKIASVLGAILLWLVVVNVDDPVISRTYPMIPVEVENSEVITDENKTYEILDGTGYISVMVMAKRSVIEDMSKDYIKATADLKELTFMNTAPIQVRSLRYSDRIESITPITKNLRLQIEEVKKKQIKIGVDVVGEPNSGYITGTAKPNVNILSVSGPVSLVDELSYARAKVDVTGMSGNISTSSAIYLYDGDDELILDDRLKKSISEVHVDVEILTVKEVPVVFEKPSGSPADGFMASGVIASDPANVQIAGSGKKFNALSSITIPSEVLSVAGANKNVVYEVSLSDYLPEGVVFVDKEYDGKAVITINILPVATKDINVVSGNISVTNVPEGYAAVVVDTGTGIPVKVTGLQDSLDALDPATVTGTIDANTMVKRGTEGDEIVGAYDGEVILKLPEGISASQSLPVQVILNPIGLPGLDVDAAGIAGGELPPGEGAEAEGVSEGTAAHTGANPHNGANAMNGSNGANAAEGHGATEAHNPADANGAPAEVEITPGN